MTYVPLPILADLADVSKRALEKACTKIAIDSVATWRGARLVLRQIRGRGGRSGLCYEIRIDSLPPDLQLRLKAHFAIIEHPVSRISDRSTAKHNWFLLVLGPALGTAPRSPERSAAIESLQLAARPSISGKADIALPRSAVFVGREHSVQLARIDRHALPAVTDTRSPAQSASAFACAPWFAFSTAQRNLPAPRRSRPTTSAVPSNSIHNTGEH